MSGVGKFDKVLRNLQNTWIVCFGSLIVLVEAGYFLKPIVLPFVALALIVGIWAFGTFNVQRNSVNCSLLTHYSVYSLAISAVIMLIINLLNTHIIGDKFPTLTGRDLQYVSTLLVFPVAAVMFGLGLLRRSHTEYCQACKAKAGFTMSEALERNLFHHESKNQMFTAFILSTLLSIVGWGYYYLFYIDVNLNSPDTFYFFFVPFIVFVLSVGYFIGRTSNMKFEMSIPKAQNNINVHSVVRFMVIRGDQMLLEELKLKDDEKIGLWDTPAKSEMPFVENLSEADAHDIFSKLAGINDFELKFLFTQNSGGETSYHYAAFLPEDVQEIGLEGKWFTLYEVDVMLKAGAISRPFAYELHRIFTITMAWKTYDRQGRRLYPIKNYRPTFRLSDFKDWDVDYNDLLWMNISKVNEDTPFYKWRTFWRRYITGIEGKWNRNRF